MRAVVAQDRDTDVISYFLRPGLRAPDVEEYEMVSGGVGAMGPQCSQEMAGGGVERGKGKKNESEKQTEP